MPLYFTHIHDGSVTIADLEGQDFINNDAAVEDARLAAREILAEKVLAGLPLDGQSLEVCDATGRTVATIALRDQLNLVP